MESSLILYVIGSVFTIMGAWLWQKANRLIRHGKKANAIIVHNNVNKDADGSVTYHPVVRFVTDTKEVIIQELDFGVNPPMREGTSLDILYDPEEPTSVALSTSFYLEILPKILVAVGITAVIGASLEILGIISI